MQIPYCPDEPTAGQEKWLANRDRSFSFVSGRGGGKSEALVMAALQDMEVPGYNAIIFYESTWNVRYWLDKMDRWWEDDPHLRYHSPGNWIFPHGSQLCLRVFPKRGGSERYRATEWNFIGFEDVEDFSESDMEIESFLASRARGKGARVRSTFNDYHGDNGYTNPLLVNPHVEGYVRGLGSTGSDSEA